jgi:hypothetical protein
VTPAVALRTVRYHPPIGLSTLFRPLPKRGPRQTLDVEYEIPKERAVLHFSARCALGIPEQTLLLVLLELAEASYLVDPAGCRIDAQSQLPLGRELWSTLHGGRRAEGHTLYLSTSWYVLNRLMGSPNGGSNIAQRKAQLQRLCEVVVWERIKLDSGRWEERQSYLVSWTVGDDQTVHLVLNQRLASALLGGQYSRVSLTERFALGTDIAMAVHAFLSTTVRQGHSLDLRIDSVMGRLWPGDASCPNGTTRGRRKEVRAALEAIGRLPGWSVAFRASKAGKEPVACVERKADGASVGEKPSSRFIANNMTAYRQQSSIEKPIAGAASKRVDLSGLFSTKGV